MRSLPSRVLHQTPADRSDPELLAAVADGDRSALEVLYRRHAPWVTARLRRRCSDPTVVDEVLQDCFVAVWRGAGRYDGRGEVGAWLWGIAVRRLVDAVRRSPRPTDALLDVPEVVDVVGSAEEQVLLGIEHGERYDQGENGHDVEGHDEAREQHQRTQVIAAHVSVETIHTHGGASERGIRT